jgi:glucosyl-3-phosphoglycerate synthase
MSDFSQNRTRITTFHILEQDRRHLRNQLRLFSKWNKTVLIIPLLATEYTDPENLPVFENILKQLSDIRYLSNIIFGLDKASGEEAMMLKSLIPLSNGMTARLSPPYTASSMMRVFRFRNRARARTCS